MSPDNNSDRRKKLLFFSLTLLATAGIASVILFTLWKPDQQSLITNSTDKKTSSLSSPYYEEVLRSNKLLTGQVNALEQLDQHYLNTLTMPESKKKLDSLNELIDIKEKIFSETIDSIRNEPIQIDSTVNLVFDNIMESFKSILENRRSISSLRTSITSIKKGLNPDQMEMLKNQNLLQEKNVKIALLENLLKTTAGGKSNSTVAPPIDANNDKLTLLQDAVTRQDAKIAALTTANANLKLDNERQSKQQTDAEKAGTESEFSFKIKATAFQKRIDALNAELRLAQVDCNLSRVDARQIIYTSKQRKELLSEASSILTNLSQSEDADIRKKVQTKISRLNQVAANSKE